MEKSKARAKEAYRQQLKRCGFRAWSAANKRRIELIMRFKPNDLTGEECEELDRLQQLADLYVDYTCFDFRVTQVGELAELEAMLANIAKQSKG